MIHDINLHRRVQELETENATLRTDVLKLAEIITNRDEQIKELEEELFTLYKDLRARRAA